MLCVAIYSTQISYPNHATRLHNRENVAAQVLAGDPHMYPWDSVFHVGRFCQIVASSGIDQLPVGRFSLVEAGFVFRSPLLRWLIDPMMMLVFCRETSQQLLASPYYLLAT